MTTNNIRYLKENGIAFVEDKSQFFEFIDSQWVSIGSFTENYTSVSLDSDGYLQFTFESDYDPVQNAFSPLISLTSTDNSNNPISYTLTSVNPLNGGGIIKNISGANNTYTVNPNKLDNDLGKDQVVKIETSSIPDLGFDSIDSDYFADNYITKLSAEIYYNYYGANISSTNHAKISKLINIATPSVEYMALAPAPLGSQDIKGLHFKPDGTKIFTVRNSTVAYIEQYDLSKPFDVTSLDSTTYKKYEFYQGPNSDKISDLFLSLNGDKMFLVSSSFAKIYELYLTSPFDVSTAKFESSELINDKLKNPLSLTLPGTRYSASMRPGGNDFEIVQNGMTAVSLSDNVIYSWQVGDSDKLQNYDISFSGKAISGSSINNYRSLSLGGNLYQQSQTFYGWASTYNWRNGAIRYYASGWKYYYPHNAAKSCFTFSPATFVDSSGNSYNYMYYASTVSGYSGKIWQYKLSDPYNISSATNLKSRTHTIGFVQGHQYVNNGDNGIQKIRWSGDGSKLFLLDTYRHKIYSYLTNEPYMISQLSSNDSASTRVLQPISSSIVGEGGYYQEMNLSPEIPTNPSELSYIDAKGGAVNVSGLNYFDFNKDGTKLIVNNHKDVYEYHLTDAYDISTASHIRTHTNLQQYMSKGSAVKIDDSDETNLYVSSSNVITQFTIDSFSDISSAVLRFDSDGLDVQSIESTPNALTMNDSGTIVLLGGNTNNNIHRIDLNTSNKITDANLFLSSTFISPPDITNLSGLTTNSTFTKLFATSDKSIYQISMSDSFNLSTYDSISYLTPQANNNINGMRWNNIGSQFTICGDNEVEKYKTKNTYQVIPI